MWYLPSNVLIPSSTNFLAADGLQQQNTISISGETQGLCDNQLCLLLSGTELIIKLTRLTCSLICMVTLLMSILHKEFLDLESIGGQPRT